MAKYLLSSIIKQMNNFFYKVNDQEYEVVIIHKHIKNVHYRFRDGKFFVSCNRWILKSQITSGLDKFGARLIKASTKPAPIGDDYIYLFGDKVTIANSGRLSFGEHGEFTYKNREDLLKKIKKVFLKIATERTNYYSKLMAVPEYKVGIRDMKTRHGSNSKRTKHINYAFHLVHYSTEIIDSVIVHELAHCKVFNHSKAFYDVVYKYCPKYDEYHAKLNKGVFHA